MCDVEVAFLHTDMPSEMFAEFPEGIVELGIIKKLFLEEYCILLGNSIYVYMDADILFLRMLSK